MNPSLKRFIYYVLVGIIGIIIVDYFFIYKENKWDTVVVIANGVPTFSKPNSFSMTGLLEKGSRGIVMERSQKDINAYIKRDGLDYFIKINVHKGSKNGQQLWIFGNDSEGLDIIHK